jgi:hypothetical protein
MIDRFWTAASVAALSVVLAAPAFPQQLRQTVTNQLNEHSIEVPNLASMSNSELAQIQLLLNTTEGNDAQKQAMVDNLLAEKAPCEGNPQLRQSVANQLKEHRIEIKNYDNITGSELVVIKTVLDSTESNAAKRAQIGRLFSEKQPISQADYLRADAEQCVKMVGADLNVDDLTPNQMLQIQAVASGSDDMNAKRAMIEKIGNQ